MRSGPSTARALAAVGKAAATVDNVIHLARPASMAPTHASTEIVAHELVHAARPSPVPRFFDDDHNSPEEDVARSTGRLMRALGSPSDAEVSSGSRANGTAGLAVGAGLLGALSTGSRNVIRRELSGGSGSLSGSTSSGDGIAALLPQVPIVPSLAASAAQAGSSSPAADVSGGGAPEVATPGDGMALASQAGNGGSAGDDSSIGTMRRMLGDIDPSSQSAVSGPAAVFSSVAEARSAAPDHVGVSEGPPMNELIERIIEAIEDRVIDELERRGRRHNPGVF
ncbi:MAG TPA: DUF4157 domain-containing protein [Acidimicrobiales bacterium]